MRCSGSLDCPATLAYTSAPPKANAVFGYKGYARRRFWTACLEKKHIRAVWVAFGSDGARRASEAARRSNDPVLGMFGVLAPRTLQGRPPAAPSVEPLADVVSHRCTAQFRSRVPAANEEALHTSFLHERGSRTSLAPDDEHPLAVLVLERGMDIGQE